MTVEVGAGVFRRRRAPPFISSVGRQGRARRGRRVRQGARRRRGGPGPRHRRRGAERPAPRLPVGRRRPAVFFFFAFTAAVRHAYAAADIAKLAADPKADKAYRKKFAKFEKAFRKKWAKDAALRGPYVIPDEAALAAVFRSLEPPHWGA